MLADAKLLDRMLEQNQDTKTFSEFKEHKGLGLTGALDKLRIFAALKAKLKLHALCKAIVS